MCESFSWWGRRHVCAGPGGTTGVWLGPHQDSQQWALTFQCGFVCLCLDLKGHCISVSILLLFIGECSPIKTCLNMGTPWWYEDSFSANAKGLGQSPSGAVCHGSPFFSLTFSTHLYELAFAWFLIQFLLGQAVNVSSHAFTSWIRILVSCLVVNCLASVSIWALVDKCGHHALVCPLLCALKRSSVYYRWQLCDKKNVVCAGIILVPTEKSWEHCMYRVCNVLLKRRLL